MIGNAWANPDVGLRDLECVYGFRENLSSIICDKSLQKNNLQDEQVISVCLINRLWKLIHDLHFVTVEIFKGQIRLAYTTHLVPKFSGYS